jgi:hypothetical protein
VVRTSFGSWTRNSTDCIISPTCTSVTHDMAPIFAPTILLTILAVHIPVFAASRKNNAKDRDAGARVSKLAVADTCQPHHRLIMRLLRRNVLSTVACNTLDSMYFHLGCSQPDSLVGVLEWRALPCIHDIYDRLVAKHDSKITGATGIAWIIFLLVQECSRNAMSTANADRSTVAITSVHLPGQRRRNHRDKT